MDYFSEFDLIISFLYDPDEIFKTNVNRCSKAQFIVGPHRPDESVELHATEAFLKPLEKLAIFQADATPRDVEVWAHTDEAGGSRDFTKIHKGMPFKDVQPTIRAFRRRSPQHP